MNNDSSGNGTANDNTAVGSEALENNVDGSQNTAVGAEALVNNLASNNTGVGFDALNLNTTGENNAAVGAFALYNNNSGNRNNAVGFHALLSHITGDFNNAVGAFALAADTAGGSNNAFGDGALASNTAGVFNTAVGDSALDSNTTGAQNTAVGTNALSGNHTGDSNIALGFNAGTGITTANNVICIGNIGQDVTDSTWIGNVYGVTTQSGTTAPVVVSDGGQLGTAPSSERFKKDIARMDKASEDIISLRPVTFHYKTDTRGTPQFGLIAEEVAKVNAALVLPDKEGKPYTVRYDAVNAMLLNEFLKEHHKVQELEASNLQLKHDFAEQQKQIDALTAGLQKMSAQLELNKSTPQTVLNNR
jgi:hypothetical protein